MMDLAKATFTGDLLEEIISLANDSTDGGMHAINDWTSLRAHVVEHFLFACKDIRLQTQLESARQRMGESTPAYVRHFQADATRVYGTKARAVTEETRVVASFLCSLADRQFAEKLYRTGSVAKLDSAIKVALEKEAEREKMEQMLRSRGEEPMEVGAINSTGHLLDLMGTMQQRLEQVSTRLAKMEAAASAKSVSPKRMEESQPNKQRPNRLQQGCGKSLVAGKAKRRPDHKWEMEDRPICNRCGKPGHQYCECTAYQKMLTAPSVGGGDRCSLRWLPPERPFSHCRM